MNTEEKQETGVVDNIPPGAILSANPNLFLTVCDGEMEAILKDLARICRSTSSICGSMANDLKGIREAWKLRVAPKN